LRFAYFEEAEIGGEAVDAEEIQEIGVGEEGDAGEFLKGALSIAGEETIFLEAGEAGDFVAFFEIGVAGFDDFGKAEGPHDFTELDGRHVLGEVGHPDAHGGVDGEIFYAGEGLAFGDRGDGGFGEFEDVGSDEAGGAIGEEPLTICGGHGERVEEEWEGSQKKKKKEFNAEFAESAEGAEKRGVRLNLW
jgi:hypothetical protein